MKFLWAICLLASLGLAGCSGGGGDMSSNDSMAGVLKDAQKDAGTKDSGGGKRTGMVKADANMPNATNK